MLLFEKVKLFEQYCQAEACHGQMLNTCLDDIVFIQLNQYSKNNIPVFSVVLGDVGLKILCI